MYEVHYLTNPDDDIKICFLYDPESYKILNLFVYYQNNLQCVYDAVGSNCTVIDSKYHINVPSEYNMAIHCTLTNYKRINKLDADERARQLQIILQSQDEFIDESRPNGFNVPELNIPSKE